MYKVGGLSIFNLVGGNGAKLRESPTKLKIDKFNTFPAVYAISFGRNLKVRCKFVNKSTRFPMKPHFLLFLVMTAGQANVL